jgi:ArsR family transcriptional regulator, arsenate/arsenite/antimonite-responsive transcriptional repressor / arsenate reductase (thioredoxin)
VDLAGRARFHAALGEPGRLAIVDALSVNDLSPGDLAQQLGFGSNLVAHHLRVLEEAGIIRRSKSEGDRRRSYVRLRPDNPLLAALDLAPRLEAEFGSRRRVVFVCTRNSARSQLAASAWKRVSSLPAISAGTHPADRVHPGAVRTAKRHGLPLADTTTRHLDDVITPDDLVVAVCDQVHEELPDAPRLHWSVPDPVPSATPGDFDAAFDDIVQRVGRLATTLDLQPE